MRTPLPLLYTVLLQLSTTPLRNFTANSQHQPKSKTRYGVNHQWLEKAMALASKMSFGQGTVTNKQAGACLSALLLPLHIHPSFSKSFEMLKEQMFMLAGSLRIYRYST